MDDEEGIWSMRDRAGNCAARRMLNDPIYFYFKLVIPKMLPS